MILEQLISAYLDGELGQEQDAELRSMISSDPAAKQAFDSAVLIHIAMRCEDDTAVPDGLRSGVFDVVDAFAQPIQRKTRGFRNVAAVAMLFMLVSIPLSESYRQLTRLISTESVAANTSVQQLVVPEQQQRSVGVANSEVTNSADANTEIAVYVIDNNAVDNNTSTTDISAKDNQPTTLASVFAASTSMMPSISESGNRESSVVRPEPISTRVTVSTMYAAGADMLNAGASDIRQISASIGYGVAESDIVGLEVGSTSYSIEQQTTVLRAFGSFSSMRVAPADGGNVPGKLASPEQGSTEYASESKQMQSNQSTAWGSAFYERRILQQHGLSLNARAGAGFGEDGALGYGRLMCEWELGGILSVVVGGEARFMPFRTGADPNKVSSSTYGTAITGLTGIHLRF